MASLTNEVPNQRSLKNGYHGSRSETLIQYKKREVSALRDFPPKCGTNAEPITPEALLDVIVCIDDHVSPVAHDNSSLRSFPSKCGIKAKPITPEALLDVFVCIDDHATLDNSFQSGIVVEENQSIVRGVKASGEMEFQENGVVQYPDYVAAAVANKIIETEVVDLGLPKSSERNDMAVPHGNSTLASTCDVLESKAVKTEDVVVDKVGNTILTSEMEIQFDEAVGCPMYLEENVWFDTVDNLINVTTLDFKSLQVQLPEDIKRNDSDLVKVLNEKDFEVKSIGENEVKSFTEICVVAHKDFQTSKDKSSRGKVSVSRDFPPNCGKNGPPLTEVERAKIFFETECLETELQSSNEALEPIGSVVVTNDSAQSDWLTEREVSSERISSHKVPYDDVPVIVTVLMAAPNCPWVSPKVTVLSEDRKTKRKVEPRLEVKITECKVDDDKVISEDGKSECQVEKPRLDWRKKSGVVAKKSIPIDSSSKRSPIKKMKNSPPAHRPCSDELQKDPETGHKNEFIVNIPPFGFSSIQHTDARNKVKEMLRLYQTICRKITQGEEAKSEKFEKNKRIDLEAKKILDQKGVELNTDKDRIGSVPGVEVGDEFQYRVELAIVGVHRLYQAGIDYTKKDNMVIATSIVASGVYADGWDNADVLIYSGQGGNVIGKKKEPEDQKLERGNLALSNSVKTKNPIRVVRGSKETKSSDSLDSKSSKVVATTYVYDGLYTVEKCWPETGPRGKMVYMFELRRIPGQPELAWKEVNNAKIGKLRRGVCVADISGGQEKLPICAVNLIDDEKPPAFTYIREMKYPDGFRFIVPQGCICTTRCSDSRKCSCRPKNGGELPYNRNGAIVEVKPIVYECGPSCKCPSSCYNRVSQHGIKIQLEIFKTENRGWGVRSLASIPSGSFICEYAGELLDDKEAELRTGSDEYLFDIGKNNAEVDGGGGGEAAVEEGGGYTVDAAVYGNIGRFINHSCSPNLYAQDVLYDHGDKKMPHVMLFAADNIPPLQELTYDYNYSMNQVHDSDGNIKMKSCYCGSTECRGRLY